MNDKAEIILKEMNTILASIENIDKLTKEMVVDNDLKTLLTFKGPRECDIAESGLLLMAKLEFMSRYLSILGNVGYVLNLEERRPRCDWREHAKVGHIVNAIKELREFSNGILSVKEAGRVVTFYIDNPF